MVKLCVMLDVRPQTHNTQALRAGDLRSSLSLSFRRNDSHSEARFPFSDIIKRPRLPCPGVLVALFKKQEGIDAASHTQMAIWSLCIQLFPTRSPHTLTRLEKTLFRRICTEFSKPRPRPHGNLRDGCLMYHRFLKHKNK